MKRTVYQVWRLSPTKNEWYHYKHLPDCATLPQLDLLFTQHRQGEYKGNQFKSWMSTDKFKYVQVTQQFVDASHIIDLTQEAAE